MKKNMRSTIDSSELLVYDEPDMSGWNVELPDSAGGGYITFETQDEAVFFHSQLQNQMDLEQLNHFQ
jgi:hypothetical protein